MCSGHSVYKKNKITSRNKCCPSTSILKHRSYERKKIVSFRKRFLNKSKKQIIKLAEPYHSQPPPLSYIQVTTKFINLNEKTMLETKNTNLGYFIDIYIYQKSTVDHELKFF